MTNVKCVIGANFGDEGKGLMTDYFAENARLQDKKCLNILSNGGAQRGHTVRNGYGKGHVFRHFGSGTFAGAHTYLPEEYIVNPMIFREEREDLVRMGVRPTIFMSGNNLCSTPYDSMLNMIIEDSRGDNRHGSCGVGIWETIVRNGLRMDGIRRLSAMSFKNYLNTIRRDYVPQRLNELGLEIPDNWKEILDSDILMDNYIDDIMYMAQHCIFINDISDEYTMFKSYDTIIFENGQGLLLDKNIKGYGENTTPSSTGIRIPAKYIKMYSGATDIDSIEICYVTRSYMTRHGAGRFDSECKKEDINPKMVDYTNVHNQYQGTLRYGTLDIKDLEERCLKDFESNEFIRLNAKMSIAVTHLDDYKGIDSLSSYYVRYVSSGPYFENVGELVKIS